MFALSTADPVHLILANSAYRKRVGLKHVLLIIACLLATTPTPVLAQSEQAKVLLETVFGDIEIGLYLDRAPTTARNFLALVASGHLNGGSFNRTVTYDNDNGVPKIEVIQEA